MYAQHRYQPPKSRTAGVAGALAVSGLLAAGMSLLAPQVATVFRDRILETYPVPIPAPPPPIPDETRPKPQRDVEAQNQKVVAPDPVISTKSQTDFATTEIVPKNPPTPDFAEKAGPENTVADTPKPVPPLVGAAQDARFARDFQPQYPAIEQRAQRSGSVSVRVLIGTDGRVKAVEQVSASSPAFFEATRRQALGKWRFRPANRGGVAEESWKMMTVRFRIDEQ